MSTRGFGCKGYRLPTEAEWEYAARAGSVASTYAGDLKILGERNAPILDGIAWYGGNSGVTYSGGYDCHGWKATQYPASSCGPHPIQQKRPNAWGLSDMLGNVFEWCWDWYGEYGDVRSDPQGPSSGTNRVFRGGAWSYDAGGVRAANRLSTRPGSREWFMGFRLCRTP